MPQTMTNHQLQKDSLTMQSLQGEITKQMSQATFKQLQKVRQSHDFPRHVMSTQLKPNDDD